MVGYREELIIDDFSFLQNVYELFKVAACLLLD